LDLAEVFKPVLVDRLIFSMLNKREIQANDFRWDVGGCLLKPEAAQRFTRAFEAKLSETFMHRTLGRNVSYKHLIRLECYKLVKDILGDVVYKPFKIYW
jgi:CRISP-associated protein Cas1